MTDPAPDLPSVERPLADAMPKFLTARGGICMPSAPYYSFDGPAPWGPVRPLTRQEKIKRWAQARLNRRRIKVASWVAGFDVDEDHWYDD
jgi:hypothetical protein